MRELQPFGRVATLECSDILRRYCGRQDRRDNEYGSEKVELREISSQNESGYFLLRDMS